MRYFLFICAFFMPLYNGMFVYSATMPDLKTVCTKEALIRGHTWQRARVSTHLWTYAYNMSCCDQRLACSQRPRELCCLYHNRRYASQAENACKWHNNSCSKIEGQYCKSKTIDNCLIGQGPVEYAYRLTGGQRIYKQVTYETGGFISREESGLHLYNSVVNGTCTHGGGPCSYRCAKKAGSYYGQWEEVSNNCNKDCSATTINNCKVSSGLSNQRVRGVCVNGTISRSYSPPAGKTCAMDCRNSRWVFTPTPCFTPCPSKTVNHCFLKSPSVMDRTAYGTCEDGYVAAGATWSGYGYNACKDKCTRGQWSKFEFLYACSLVTDNDYCPASEGTYRTGFCVLPKTLRHKTVTGHCRAGYTAVDPAASCKFSCLRNPPSWYSAGGGPSCSRENCSGGTQTETRITGGKCILPAGNNNSTVVGMCKNRRYKGSCSYRCNSNTWSYVSSTCERARDCSGGYQHGQMGTVSLSNSPYVMECRDGTWVKITPDTAATYRTIYGHSVTFKIDSDGKYVITTTYPSQIDY